LGLLPDAEPRPSDPNPADAGGLARALGNAHRRYSAFVNARMRVTGHLFHARFSSVVMDEDHLMAAARHVALNPARARLAARPEDWPWSSVGAHLARRDDGLVEVAPLLERCSARCGAGARGRSASRSKEMMQIRRRPRFTGPDNARRRKLCPTKDAAPSRPRPAGAASPDSAFWPFTPDRQTSTAACENSWRKPGFVLHLFSFREVVHDRFGRGHSAVSRRGARA
jgi:hypothetical protein